MRLLSALLLLASCSATDPNNSAELYQAAKQAFANGSPQSIILFQQVVQLSPKHAQAWDDLGRAYIRFAQLSLAEQSFRKQIEIEPFHPTAYQHLAGVYMNRDRAESERLLRKQIDVNPLSAEAHAILGSLLIAEKRSEEAILVLDIAARIEPKSSQILFDLGRAHAELRHVDEALDNFRKSIETSDHPPVHRIWAARSLAQNSLSLDQAKEWAESGCDALSAQARNLDLAHSDFRTLPPSVFLPNCWISIFEVYSRTGQEAAAEKFLRAAWRFSQTRESGEKLAEFYESKGRIKEALEIYAQAASMNSNVGPSRARLKERLKTDAAVSAAIERAKGKLENMRTLQFAANRRFKGSGNVLLAERPDGTAEQFVLTNDEGNLRARLDLLKSLFKDEGFPDKWPTLYPRAGVLHCSNLTKACMLVFLTFNQTGFN